MLHRSFKPAKCKTSLKLAVSRIKLLKNKKVAQVTQLKRELAQLLESGKEQTARIRVEHVVREEKALGAYDLIEIYCEIVAARLPIIESQKNCPIDLKEAITSIVFASPRCADIPELLDIRKHFTAKYGKEFISSAVELRPECGVSRQLAEKLSVIAPDGPTKIKILSAIAEEHNINWDPSSFGEKDAKPHEDLLNGPNTFQNASNMFKEPPSMPAQPNRDQKHDAPVHQHDVRSSTSFQNFAATDTGAKTTTSDTSHPELRPSGTGSERMDYRHSYAGDGNDFHPGNQNWNMEFKDATTAAQAAAESAERASMAARAAAELSSGGRISRQYSSESQKSSVHGRSELRGEHPYNDSVSNSFHDRNSRAQNEQIHDRHSRMENEQVHGRNSRMQDEPVHDRDSRMRDEPVHDRDSRMRDEPVDDRNSRIRDEQVHDRDSRMRDEPVHDRDSRMRDEPVHDRNSRIRDEQVHDRDSRMRDEPVHDRNSRIRDEQVNDRDSRMRDEPVHDRDSRMRDEPVHDRNSRIRDEQVHDRNSRMQDEQVHDRNSRMRDEQVHDRSSRMRDEQRDEHKQDSQAGVAERFGSISHTNTKRSSRAASLKSNTASLDDETLFYSANSLQKTGGYPQKRSSVVETTKPENDVFFNEVGMEKQSSESEDEAFSEIQDSTRTENIDYFVEDSYRKQSSSVSSPPQSRNVTDEYDVSHSNQRFGNDGGVRLVSMDEESVLTHSNETPSGKAPVLFDESDSDDEQVSTLFFTSPGRKSPVHHSEIANPWSSTQNIGMSFEQSHLFTDGRSPPESLKQSASPSQLDESFRVTFDDSDGPNSENEEMEKSKVGSILSPKENVYSKNPEPSQSECGCYTGLEERNSGTEYNSESQKKSGFGVMNEEKPDTMKDVEFLNKSSLDGGLNFGTLPGGFRNKGYIRPPYTKSPSGDSLSSTKQQVEDTFSTGNYLSSTKQQDEDSFSTVEKPIVSSTVKTGAYSQRVGTKENKKKMHPKPQVTYFASDSDDDYDKELPHQNLVIEVDNKSSRKATSYFDSDNDDSEEEFPISSMSRRGPAPSPGGVYSRRTKAAPKPSEKSSYAKVKHAADVSGKETKPSKSSTFEQPRSATESSRISLREESLTSSTREPPPQSSYTRVEPAADVSGKETTKRTESSTFERPRSMMESSKISSREEKLTSSTSEPTPQTSLPKMRSSGNSLPKMGSSESSKVTSSSRDPPSRENSITKASHVHPKLPDYETLTAHLQSLRTDGK